MIKLHLSELTASFNEMRVCLLQCLRAQGITRVAVWGAGTNGFLVAALLYDSPIEVVCFYDQKRTAKLMDIDVCPVPADLSLSPPVVLAMDGPEHAVTAISDACKQAGIPCIHVASPFSSCVPDVSLGMLHRHYLANKEKLLQSMPVLRGKLSLWGAGKNGWALLLLLRHSEFDVSCVYDGMRMEPLFGIPVCPEPSRLDDGDVVLITMNGPEKVVERIKDICFASHARSLHVMNDYTRQGTLSGRQMHLCEPRDSYDSIKEMFHNPDVEVISFDVFDTLLCRPVLAPTDLFYIVERRIQQWPDANEFPFRKVRLRAEKEARCRNVEHNGNDSEDITLDEIYDVFVDDYEVDRQLAVRMKDVEFQVERDYLRPRMAGQALFNLAQEAGKRVVLISDVYLSGKQVEQLLRDNGYCNYERCVTSADYRKTKMSGRLYLRIQEEWGVKAKVWIHVGDNVQSDMRQAREFGLKTVYLPSAVNQFWDHRSNVEAWLSCVHQLEPSFRLVLGMIANHCFDDPFERVNNDDPSLFRGKADQLGYYAGGPWLFFMVKWLLEQVSKAPYSMLHMIARDGYIPLEIYNRLRMYYPDSPDTNYLHISRMISHASSLKNRCAVMLSHEELPVLGNVTCRTILHDRYFVDEPERLANALDALGYSLDETPGSYERFIKDCLEDQVIGEKLAESLTGFQERIKKYYQQEFREGDKHAIFDIGYTGKIQACLNESTGLDLDGFYFSSSFLPNADGEYPVRAWNYMGAPVNDRVTKLFARGIAENVMSDSRTGSMVGLQEHAEGKIAPVWADHAVDEYTLRVQRKIQSGIIQFADDMIDLFRDDIKYLQVTPGTAFYLMNRYMNEPYARDAEIFLDVGYENGSTGKSGCLIAEGRRSDSWIPGYDALFGAGGKHKRSIRDFGWNTVRHTMGKLPVTAGSRQVLWIDYAQVRDKYDFVSAFAACDPSMNCLLLDGYVRGTHLENQNAAIINPPPSICNCHEYESQYVLPDDPYVRATLQVYAAHYHYLLIERQDASYEQALSAVIQAYDYTCNVLREYKPHVALIWNEFYPLSRVAQFACDMMNVKTAYLEFGVLPGTIQLDRLGQVGESWIARQTDRFNSLSVTSQDLETAQRVLQFYKESEINRRQQPQYGLLRDRLKGIDKKIIFLAGHNNYSSGVFPYDLNARNQHSPLFRDTWQLFDEMVAVAEENDWFLVFKPHPYSKKYLPKRKQAAHYMVVDAVNINECLDLCDVVVTVLSQINYMAFIREKPVVMLGYTALLNKGCCYEAFSRDDIAVKINKALKHVDEQNMRRNGLEHVARLLKYSLYLYKQDCVDQLPARSVNDFAVAVKYLSEKDADDYELAALDLIQNIKE